MSSRAVGTRTVGAGDVSLTTAAARGLDRAAVSRALHAAIESGLDLVDISVEDDAERLVGETIRDLRLRDKVVAAPRIPALTTLPSGAATRDLLVERLPARYVVARVEALLRTTRLEVLPLAQLELRAAWRGSSAWPELVGTCARLVKEGKVLAWGALAARVEDDTADLAFEPWLASLSVPFSLCERAAKDVIIGAAKALEAPGDSAEAKQQAHLRAAGLSPELAIMAGMPAELILAAAADAPVASTEPAAAPRSEPIAILARRPLAGAALAGTLGPGVRIKPRDDRNDVPAAQLEKIAVTVARLSRFTKQTPPAARSCAAAMAALERTRKADHIECESLAELALRYVLTHGAIALPRLHRHEHVLDAVAASVLPPLPPDLLALLEELDF